MGTRWIRYLDLISICDARSVRNVLPYVGYQGEIWTVFIFLVQPGERFEGCKFAVCCRGLSLILRFQVSAVGEKLRLPGKKASTRRVYLYNFKPRLRTQSPLNIAQQPTYPPRTFRKISAGMLSVFEHPKRPTFTTTISPCARFSEPKNKHHASIVSLNPKKKPQHVLFGNISCATLLPGPWKNVRREKEAGHPSGNPSVRAVSYGPTSADTLLHIYLALDKRDNRQVTLGSTSSFVQKTSKMESSQ